MLGLQNFFDVSLHEENPGNRRICSISSRPRNAFKPLSCSSVSLHATVVQLGRLAQRKAGLHIDEPLWLLLPNYSVSVSVALLLARLGSGTPPGEVTLALFEIEPVADALMVPVAL